MGQSGDWCNECPGFDKDDCFKLSDETRKKWIEEIVNTYPDHTADIGKKVSISCGRENDLISRQEALKKLAAYIHLIDKTMGKGTLTDDGCMEAAKSVLGEDELPAVQPEIIRCKDCKYRDENWRRVSVRWLPCMDVRTGSNWYCGSAERCEQDE